MIAANNCVPRNGILARYGLYVAVNFRKSIP